MEDAEAVCADPGSSCLDELELLVDKALVHVDGQGERLRVLQTVAEFAREQLEAAEETEEIELRHARRYARAVREIRDGIEGADQVRSVARGIAEEANVQAAFDALLSAARGGDAEAAERGMQMSGDLWMYWHLRGKNVTAREVATAFLDANAAAPSTVGRAGALTTVGLASWMLGEYAQSLDEWSQAYAIAEEIGLEREACIAAMMQGLALLFIDPVPGLEWEETAMERSRAAGFTWAEAFASSFAGILHAVLGDADSARARYANALELQQRIGDREGAGLSLGGLAQLASASDQTVEALDLYRRALAAFEDVGDRAEEARILGETGWTYLATGDATRARATFFDAVQAHRDIASVRGVGLSLIGLAAAAVVEGHHEIALQIATAAERYAMEEGIAVVYSDDTPGKDLVEQARAALTDDEVARATEAGRRLSIAETLDVARTADRQQGRST
jgi:tetratricopeptide (TPR) repeat protein